MTTRPATSPIPNRPIVDVVVPQHAEEAALLRLGRLDERLAAHLNGLAVIGPAGRDLCLAALERPGTGADLALLDLETLAAPDRIEQPDAADDDGSLDEDDSLPWPDPSRIQAWWASEEAAFDAATQRGRLFLDRPITAQAARHVIAEGTQRQRAHAALLASLLQPGRPLFQVAAPVARQRRALAEWRA